MLKSLPLLLCTLAILAAGLVPATHVRADSAISGPPGPPIPGLTLTASPQFADVGASILLVLTSKKWPGPVSATASFLSPHHGFTGKMQWVGACACFKVAVALAKRIHSLEAARAVAAVVYRGIRYSAPTSFMIRGLDRNGLDFAPGGPKSLITWVSDPQPNRSEKLHYCAWVKTPDGLGVPRVLVKFVVHLPKRTLTLSPGVTRKTGIICGRRTFGSATVGKAVRVDTYAGSMHAQTQFTPRK